MVYDLVIIGAGPCGIAAAVEGKLAGLRVALLEKGADHSQTINKFYKEGKRVDKAYKGAPSETLGNVEFSDGTKESTLEYFDSLLARVGGDLVLGCEVEGVVAAADLGAGSADADGADGANAAETPARLIVKTANGDYPCRNALIAIGKMGKANRPAYKLPHTLAARINFNANSCAGGEKILVVGGGNSAAEYAVDLCDENATTMCYRRASFSRLNDINLRGVEECAAAGKLALKLGLDIEGVQDDGGKPRVLFADGTSEVYDRVIYAIGGSTPVDFLQKCGVGVREDGTAAVDENLRAGAAGLYVGGDIISKSGSIVLAFNDAHKVVTAILAERGE